MIHTIDLQFLGQPHVIAAFLIETGGGLALVETGPYSTFPQLKAGIENLGHRAEDVTQVFLSHIHFDHAGAAWWFARQGATVYVHPRGYKHLQDPGRLLESASRIYGDMMDSLWGRMEIIPQELLVQVRHGEDAPLGAGRITAWHTPGHAVHHIAWQLGDSLFCGDVGGVRIGDSPVVPPCPPPDINREDWNESLDLIRRLPLRALYLTHYGKITKDIPGHLDELKQRLHDWTEWMKPYFEADTPQAEIVLLFRKMVRDDLRGNGVESEKELAQYEAANPSYMGVAGLMRYWIKRQ